MSIKKLKRLLRDRYSNVEVEITHGGHLRIRLPNGRSVFCGATPSDDRNIKNIDREVRRQLKM